jgi:Fe-S cluster assembly protein SufD
MKETDPYLGEFERFEKTGPAWLYPIRQAGIARFADLGFPTMHDEDWRFTNVAPIAKLPFRPLLEANDPAVTAAEIDRQPFGKIKGCRLVFVDGFFSSELSSVAPLAKGCALGSLAAAAAEEHPALQKHLAQHARADKNAFTALNTAFFTDGAFIYVPDNMDFEHPVHLLFLSTGRERGATTFPRNLIIAGKNSRLAVIESYAGMGDEAYFTNAVTEFVVGENAAVEHCKFQDESTAAFHMAALHASISRSANFIYHSIALGGQLSRNNIHTALNGAGVECILNGLYLTRDNQVADHWMFVEHAQPDCNSHEYFNGILDANSRGVFHGRIFVHQAAQKTDAKQTNKNLLLSDNATANTKPQLEIYADDVKCTHGATIGQLNEDAIFYLRARGVGHDTAKRMLIHAFAGEITERVRLRPLRDELDQLVWDRLEQNEQIAVSK